MTTNPPLNHLQDAQKLESDGRVELFEIQLPAGGVLYVKNNNTVTYQGIEYEGLAVQLRGVSRSADDSVSRPQLTVVNKEAMFSASVANGEIDKAIVIRRRVLYDDLVNDRPKYTEESWTVSRCISLNHSVAVFELRGQMDGQFFLFPPRMFIPPEFTQVSLQ